jgi:hypothetical protein
LFTSCHIVTLSSITKALELEAFPFLASVTSSRTSPIQKHTTLNSPSDEL